MNDHKNPNKNTGKSTGKGSIPDCNAIHFQDKSSNSASAKDHESKKKKPKTIDPKKPTLLKGYVGSILCRYCCNCEASKHSLINNCLKCGRIVCEQEGSGPCYVCGNLVCTPEEQLQLHGDAAKGAKLYQQLLMKKKPKGLEEALQHRDKLLDFDKNTRKHTHVFDDDSDYFCAANPWLTLDQRESMRQKEEEFFSKKYESRKDKKIVLCLKSKQIMNEDVKVNRNAFLDEADISKLESNAAPDQVPNENIVDHLLDPFFASFDIKFQKLLKADSSKNLNSQICHSRIMDTEIQRVVDSGYCISLHQPWASFLVHGIKTAEGRTWYTPYRGKLWIASTSSRVTSPDIEKHENTYRFIKDNINFPKDYPCGCLLGCVDLIDCLTQEQYSQEFPNGEVGDPYVFICENPLLLNVRYPIRGKPNIYKLDEKIHKAAAASLRIKQET